MAESGNEKSKVFEKQTPAKQSDSQLGSIGHLAASGAGASAPPLDGAGAVRIQRSPQQAPRSDILALQRSAGNRAVSAIVRGDATDVTIQAKLEVGPVNDSYEQEADRVARMVTSGITQRKPSGNVKSREEESAPGPALSIKRMMQRKGDESAPQVRADGGFSANASIQQRVRRMEQGGRPLTDSVRRQMEPGFGSDLGGVRIHTGGDAVQLSRDIGAKAFTHGTHIAFASGQYNPNSRGGRSLLAHELTHTIQQAGARPLPTVQRTPKRTSGRGPKGVIQRASTWERFKGFITRSKPQAVKVEPVPGNSLQIQTAAQSKAERLMEEARAAEVTSKAAALRKKEEHTNTLGSGTGDAVVHSTKKGGTSMKPVLGALTAMKQGDDVHKNFLDKHIAGLKEIMDKLGSNMAQILRAGEVVNDGVTSGLNDNQHKKRMALQSHALADEMEQLVASLKKQSEVDVGSEADTQMNMARLGMTKKPTSLASAEKSASDAVLDLMGMKNKVYGYHEYLTMDLSVLKEHLASKLGSVSEKYSGSAGMKAMGSGTERGTSGGEVGLMDDSSAFDLAGGAGGMKQDELEGDTEAQRGAQRKQLDKASVAAGQLHAQSRAKDGGPKKEKATLSKPQKQFAKQVKRLEIRAMLYAKAVNRLKLGDQYRAEIDKYHDEAVGFYKTIDTDRDIDDPSQGVIDKSIKDAGEARVRVAKGAITLARMYKLKKEVYDESQKYEKYVGKRAMSATTRFFKKTAGIVGGAGTRVLTGGLYSFVAEDEAGGYRVGLKDRTLADDIARKNFELEQLTKGLDGKAVRGLGGDKGVRRYAFFKKLAFGIQIVRDISSAVALWVTLVTAGVGAPVGAVFATIALFAALAKAAIDLMLLIWSSAGLANTNDPRSRAILRAENTRQGLAFGEGVFAGVSAGLTSGLSGDVGAFQGTHQTGAFSPGSTTKGMDGLGGQLASASVGPAIPLVGNIGQNVGVNVGSHYNPQVGIDTRAGNQAVAKARETHKWMRHLSHPVKSAFSKLGEFVGKKKKLRNSKFAALIPEVHKTIAQLNMEADIALVNQESQK